MVVVSRSGSCNSRHRSRLAGRHERLLHVLIGRVVHVLLGTVWCLLKLWILRRQYGRSLVVLMGLMHVGVLRIRGRCHRRRARRVLRLVMATLRRVLRVIHLVVAALAAAVCDRERMLVAGSSEVKARREAPMRVCRWSSNGSCLKFGSDSLHEYVDDAAYWC